MATSTDKPATDYERDLHAWALDNTALLRAGRLSERSFPAQCPFGIEEGLDDAFWPGEDAQLPLGTTGHNRPTLCPSFEDRQATRLRLYCRAFRRVE